MYEDYDKSENTKPNGKKAKSSKLFIFGVIGFWVSVILGFGMPAMILNTASDTGLLQSSLIPFIIMTVVTIVCFYLSSKRLIAILIAPLSILVWSSPALILYALGLNYDTEHQRHYKLFGKVVFQNLWDQSYCGEIFMTLGILILVAYIIYAKFFAQSDNEGYDNSDENNNPDEETDRISGYINDARNRAYRRKSAWNILLLPTGVIAFIAIMVALVLGAQWIHMYIYPGQTLKNSEGTGTILATVSPIFTAIPLSMIFANFLVWIIPHARNILDLEARSEPNTGFISSQKKLIVLASILISISLLFTVIGALISWH